MQRVRGASVTTFAVYVCGALVALVPALPLARSLEHSVTDHPLGGGALYAPGGTWLMEAFTELGGAWGMLANVTLVALLLTSLLSPLLQMMWLAALLRRRRLPEALAEGARRYTSALGVSLALAPLLLLAALLLVGVPGLVSLAVKTVANDRTHDLALLAACLPACLCAAVWATWHDLARASLARGASVPAAVIRGAGACFSSSAVPAYTAWLTVGAAIGVTAPLLGGLLDVGGPLATLGVLVVTQLLALARTFVRARWLAEALDRVR